MRKDYRVIPKELEPVEVQIMGEGFLDILTAKDIGESGLGVFIPTGYSCADIKYEVDLIITIPGFKSFEAGGIVKHTCAEAEKTDLRSFGIYFTRIKPEHKELLTRYVQTLHTDKRKHIRMEPSKDAPVVARTVSGENGKDLEVKDISLGGMQVKSDTPLALNSSVEDIDVIIHLPTGKKIMVQGLLRYVKESDGCYGVSFSKISDEDLFVLTTYVRQRLAARQKMIDYQG